MFKHILVPTDFSKEAMNAVELATDLASQIGARVELLNIITLDIAVRKNQAGEYESIKDTAQEFINNVISTAQKRLDKFKSEVAKKGVEIDTTVLVAEESKKLVKQILENDFDLLVVGGKKSQKLQDVFDVPIREKVIHLAECPVLIVNEFVEDFTVSQLVFATQFKEGVEQAIPVIKSLKNLFGAKCHLLYVNTPQNFKTSYELEEKFSKFIAKHGLEDFEYHIYNDKKVEDGIIRFSESIQSDLTIACTDGSRWMSRIFQGKHTEEVVVHSGQPVLIFNLDRMKERK